MYIDISFTIIMTQTIYKPKKWRDALKKARKELIKSGKIKDPKSFKSFAPKKGTPLYKRAREIYDA